MQDGESSVVYCILEWNGYFIDIMVILLCGGEAGGGYRNGKYHKGILNSIEAMVP